MRVLDLFSGIGGFSLGLERAGMRTVAFCERDAFCQAVLQKHWPTVKVFTDVAHIGPTDVEQLGRIDLVAGGFPCQPFSHAGKQTGRSDYRHLWPRMCRIIEWARPAWVLGENVTGIIPMELDSVLSDLEGLGYTPRTFVIPACAVDAPHRRDRVWIIARHPDGQGQSVGPIDASEMAELPGVVADTSSSGRRERHSDPRGRSEGARSSKERRGSSLGRRWDPEPAVGRMDDGIPRRMDRLRALGNAVVPQIVEEIGRAIMTCVHTSSTEPNNG